VGDGDRITGYGLDALLERQVGMMTRRQLVAHGFDESVVCRKVRRGEWQRALPAVFALAAAPLSGEQRRIAAALYTGPLAQLTGLAALHWHGFRHAPATDRVHVLVPHRTRRRSTGFVVVQRTHQLDHDGHETDLYTVTSAARAVVDACRASSDLRTARAIMTESVQSRFTSVARLEAEIQRAGRSRTALAGSVLREIVDGVRSLPEAELRDLVKSSAVLPRLLWNPRLQSSDGEPLPTPDGWIPDAGIALEVDSRTHHSSDADWGRTMRRHNALAQCGVQVLHFSPREIRENPRRVLRVIEQTYITRLRSGPSFAVQEGAPY
jgi:hypothetical protein